MTEIKQKAKQATEATKRGFKITWEAVERAMGWLIIIWALSTVSFFAWRIITPEVVTSGDAGFWGFVTMVISSLFVIIHSRFKK